jgi:hypothetical protein
MVCEPRERSLHTHLAGMRKRLAELSAKPCVKRKHLWFGFKYENAALDLREFRCEHCGALMCVGSHIWHPWMKYLDPPVEKRAEGNMQLNGSQTCTCSKWSPKKKGD